MTTPSDTKFPPGGIAVVIGATGGIGAALLAALQNNAGFQAATGFSRSSDPMLDLTDESSIAHCAAQIQAQPFPLRLVIDATGTLHGHNQQPEKSWLQIDARAMAQSFAINAIGPALLMKHFLPLLARDGRAVFATLSAKVGSIGDNHLGGWYSYRASKAALNQLVHTAAIELRRRAPEALCVALHPGTVATPLSAPFSKTGLKIVAPQQAVQRLLTVIEGLDANANGGFYNHDGTVLPW